MSHDIVIPGARIALLSGRNACPLLLPRYNDQEYLSRLSWCRKQGKIWKLQGSHCKIWKWEKCYRHPIGVATVTRKPQRRTAKPLHLGFVNWNYREYTMCVSRGEYRIQYHYCGKYELQNYMHTVIWWNVLETSKHKMCILIVWSESIVKIQIS